MNKYQGNSINAEIENELRDDINNIARRIVAKLEDDIKMEAGDLANGLQSIQKANNEEDALELFGHAESYLYKEITREVADMLDY
ncbi:MAG: hypothetical protein CUN57_00805 [Phototrophicales bacterium]|nr:MAG: hypothetical protein CUN57_00805 [Phototrophicales bacterium]